MAIQAIETCYKGYRFRSRLEARWAVFFDAMEYPWQYEHEGYHLPSGDYLPDFIFGVGLKPWQRLHVEIKGPEPTHEDRQLCYELSLATKRPVLLLSGNIGVDAQDDISREQFSFKSEVFCGHRVLTWGCWPYDLRFWTIGLPKHLATSDFVSAPTLPAWWLDDDERHEEYVLHLINLDKEHFRKRWGKEHALWKYGVHHDGFFGGAGHRYVNIVSPEMCRISEYMEAFSAARSARFEHGESP